MSDPYPMTDGQKAMANAIWSTILKQVPEAGKLDVFHAQVGVVETFDSGVEVFKEPCPAILGTHDPFSPDYQVVEKLACPVMFYGMPVEGAFLDYHVQALAGGLKDLTDSGFLIARGDPYFFEWQGAQGIAWEWMPIKNQAYGPYGPTWHRHEHRVVEPGFSIQCQTLCGLTYSPFPYSAADSMKQPGEGAVCSACWHHHCRGTTSNKVQPPVSVWWLPVFSAQTDAVKALASDRIMEEGALFKPWSNEKLTEYARLAPGGMKQWLV